LFDLTARDDRWRVHRRRKILRERDEFCRLLFDEHTQPGGASTLRSYFLRFAVLARRRPSQGRRNRATVAPWLSSRFVSPHGQRPSALAVAFSTTYVMCATTRDGERRPRWHHKFFSSVSGNSVRFTQESSPKDLREKIMKDFFVEM